MQPLWRMCRERFIFHSYLNDRGGWIQANFSTNRSRGAISASSPPPTAEWSPAPPPTSHDSSRFPVYQEPHFVEIWGGGGGRTLLFRWWRMSSGSNPSGFHESQMCGVTFVHISPWLRTQKIYKKSPKLAERSSKCPLSTAKIGCCNISGLWCLVFRILYKSLLVLPRPNMRWIALRKPQRCQAARSEQGCWWR